MRKEIIEISDSNLLDKYPKVCKCIDNIYTMVVDVDLVETKIGKKLLAGSIKNHTLGTTVSLINTKENGLIIFQLGTNIESRRNDLMTLLRRMGSDIELFREEGTEPDIFKYVDTIYDISEDNKIIINRLNYSGFSTESLVQEEHKHEESVRLYISRGVGLITIGDFIRKYLKDVKLC